jgi:hypothetical protein
MEKENKIIFGIAFLFTLITGFFSFPSKLSIIFTSDNLYQGLSLFLWRSSLWLVFIAGIIIILYWLNKKLNQDIYVMLSDRVIRMATAILVIIDGLIKLASLLPINFMSIKSIIDVATQAEFYANGIVAKSIITNGISLVVLLIQIVFGIYILRYHKKQKGLA